MAADFAADFHLASPSLSADLDDFVASRLLLLLHLSPAASSLSKSVLLWAVVFSSCVFLSIYQETVGAFQFWKLNVSFSRL